MTLGEAWYVVGPALPCDIGALAEALHSYDDNFDSL